VGGKLNAPHFDLAGPDRLVRRREGGVPAPVRLVLDLSADGAKLTAGGRLPRAVVCRVQERYPQWYPLGRPASVEEELLLAVLHDVLRVARLLRLRQGVVALIRAPSDEAEVIRRLRSGFGPVHGFTSVLAGETLALLATDGPSTPGALARRLHRELGYRWIPNLGRR